MPLREHVPIDFALYLPKSWTEDATRREKSKVPADLVFKTKPELALELIARAVEDKIPGEIVLVDSAYGSSSEFRNAVRAHGLDLGVAVQANTKVWPLDGLGRRHGEPVSVQDLGVKLGRRLSKKEIKNTWLVTIDRVWLLLSGCSRWAVLARQPPLERGWIRCPCRRLSPNSYRRLITALQGAREDPISLAKRSSFTNHGSKRQRGPGAGPWQRALSRRLRRTLDESTVSVFMRPRVPRRHPAALKGATPH